MKIRRYEMNVDKDQQRGHVVERCRLEYFWELLCKGQTMRGINVPPPITTLLKAKGTAAFVSDLSSSMASTDANSATIGSKVVEFSEVVESRISEVAELKIIENENNSELLVKHKRGKIKGLTKNNTKNKDVIFEKALTEAASLCRQAK
jgi:hypothetical protein